MALGSIIVDLLARTGSFETDLNRAAKQAEQRSKDIEKAFSGIGTKVGLGIAAAVSAVGVVGNQAIDQLAQLDDLTQKTGASVERLSQIQQTATAFGQDFGEVDVAISRLAKGMATVESETNKTQKALAAISVSSKDAAGNLRDPAEVLVDVARALQGYEDGASKAALVTDLFGKSGANLLPFLNDLSENVDSFKGVSAEAAAEAAKFQDQLNGLKAQFQALVQEIVGSVLPTINSLLKDMADGTKIAGGFTEAIFTLGTINPFKSQASNLETLRERLDDLNASKERYLKSGSDTRAIDDAIADTVKKLEYLKTKQRDAALALLPGASGGGADQVSRMIGGGAASRQTLNYLTGNPDKPEKAKKTQYDRDLEAAKKLIESLKTQAATFGQSDAAALKYKLTLQGLPQNIIDTASALQEQVSDLGTAKKVMDDMEAEYDRQLDQQKNAAAQIAESLLTQEQAENESYARRLEALRDYGTQSAAAAAEANALIEAENDRHTVALATIQQQQADQKNSFVIAQQSSDAQLLGQAAGVADQLYSILEKAGQQNNALGIALFAASKGLQVAQVIVQTEVAAAMVQAGLTAAAAQTAALAGPAGPAVLAAGIAAATAQATITRAIGYASAGLIAGMALSGQRANGGRVEAGKQYIVGERGREAFVPTTNGMIVPNHVLEGAGSGDKFTIINNTRGRIDAVQSQRISQDERALIISEAVGAVAADMDNPNGRTSRSLRRNTNVQRSR